ncbi:MAG: hypothetical protein RLZZ410_1515 [Pseudomonadota bacterium]
MSLIRALRFNLSLVLTCLEQTEALDCRRPSKWHDQAPPNLRTGHSEQTSKE